MQNLFTKIRCVSWNKLFFSCCLVCISMTRAFWCQFALENKAGIPRATPRGSLRKAGIPASDVLRVNYLVEESQASNFLVLLQGLPTQFLEEARDDLRFMTVVSTDEPGSTALDLFNVIDIIFLFLRCGSQTAQAHSNCGRTRHLYAVSLTSDLQFQRFLRSRPNVLLDLHITFWMGGLTKRGYH